ncbi:MAG TPA: GIY-YIG nuclease family protein [Bryobacteraceae bacterium]|nr:GIY-YIG nuclease family protein [Bryobacteraceae bacterium]
MTNSIGVYALCDLDGVPVYVGQSVDGIRSRVARHLTSARSDIIANRQIDVWEIAWVWAYPVDDRSKIAPLEATLYHHFDPKSQLMNGTVPSRSNIPGSISEPAQTIQVMSDTEIREKQDPVQRLPRQAAHYAQIVGHFLAVKESRQIARAMGAHFQRLAKYHQLLLGLAASGAVDDEQPD